MLSTLTDHLSMRHRMIPYIISLDNREDSIGHWRSTPSGGEGFHTKTDIVWYHVDETAFTFTHEKIG